MQDCKGGEVALLRGLEPHVRLLCGTDAFQDLSGDNDNEAILGASELGEVVALTEVNRTQTNGLLAAPTPFVTEAQSAPIRSLASRSCLLPLLLRGAQLCAGEFARGLVTDRPR